MSHHTQDPVCPLCEEKLSLAHPQLQGWYRSHVKPNFPDAHVSWSYRDQADQEKAFSDHKSKLHFPDSAHNKTPAMALDLFELDHSFQAKWDPKFFASVNDMNERLNIDLVWGAQFRSLGDADHFQLK